MKRIIMSAALSAALLAHADEPQSNAVVNVDEIITETMKVINEQGWTAQDVADAIRSVRQLYVRENNTKEGRARWHGKVVSSITDASNLVERVTYEDGEVFENRNVTTPQDRVNKANAKLKVTVNKNGVPAILAEARQRRADAINNGPTNVTVRITAGQ